MLSLYLQASIPIYYKGIQLDCGYRADLIVEDSLLIELKAVEVLSAVHHAQIITYLKLAQIPVGLLINFNVKLLKQGLQQFAL